MWKKEPSCSGHCGNAEQPRNCPPPCLWPVCGVVPSQERVEVEVKLVLVVGLRDACIGHSKGSELEAGRVRSFPFCSPI
uniref:Uncharacterized protein n=1 Tax=Vespula pensylvanica TaxID=30213 RepID=A0A834UGE5_VESPE|nr:hypothetical protein H0235_000454 [Vespula pensylvanica]